MAGPLPGTVSPETQYSPLLLDLFQFLLQSPDYVQRLKNHYQMFRLAVEEKISQEEGDGAISAGSQEESSARGEKGWLRVFANARWRNRLLAFLRLCRRRRGQAIAFPSPSLAEVDTFQQQS
jgi:hypothetical protein